MQIKCFNLHLSLCAWQVRVLINRLHNQMSVLTTDTSGFTHSKHRAKTITANFWHKIILYYVHTKIYSFTRALKTHSNTTCESIQKGAEDSFCRPKVWQTVIDSACRLINKTGLMKDLICRAAPRLLFSKGEMPRAERFSPNYTVRKSRFEFCLQERRRNFHFSNVPLKIKFTQSFKSRAFKQFLS
jgi:hypothetical protein